MTANIYSQILENSVFYIIKLDYKKLGKYKFILSN